jgi:hypothetical protein
MTAVPKVVGVDPGDLDVDGLSDVVEQTLSGRRSLRVGDCATMYNMCYRDSRCSTLFKELKSMVSNAVTNRLWAIVGNAYSIVGHSG